MSRLREVMYVLCIVLLFVAGVCGWRQADKGWREAKRARENTAVVWKKLEAANQDVEYWKKEAGVSLFFMRIPR